MVEYKIYYLLKEYINTMTKHKKMSENGEIYTASKNFTLPPALTALTNFNSGCPNVHIFPYSLINPGFQGIICILFVQDITYFKVLWL